MRKNKWEVGNEFEVIFCLVLIEEKESERESSSLCQMELGVHKGEMFLFKLPSGLNSMWIQVIHTSMSLFFSV